MRGYVAVEMPTDFREVSPTQDVGPEGEASTSTSLRTIRHVRTTSRITRPHLFPSLILLLSTLWCVLTYFSYAQNQVELGSWGCGMSWMNPRYIKLRGPTGEGMGGLERKYGLWLYRESGLQHEDVQPTGQPVLFIPGNAGSYQQVRSIASSAARQYSEAHRAGGSGDWVDLDFYAVDFNEEFSAFHGHTLRDQSHYVAHVIRHILSLYTASPTHGTYDNISPQPEILLVGHSMGGIVARHSLTLVHSGYDSPRDDISERVAAVIMLSSPAVLPPVGFDRGMGEVYGDVERFWVDRMKGSAGDKQGDDLPGLPPVLVSICGGTADTQISSDSCALPSYQIIINTTTISASDPQEKHTSALPATDSGTMSIYTTGMESVWTGVEHQAMVWCDQVRTKVARGLLDLGGVLSLKGKKGGGRIKRRREMTRIARREFLGERGVEVLSPSGTSWKVTIDLGKDRWTSVEPGQQKFTHEVNTESFVFADISTVASWSTIQILGRLDIRGTSEIGPASHAEIYACKSHGNKLDCMPARLGSIASLPGNSPDSAHGPFPLPDVGARKEDALAYAELAVAIQRAGTSHIGIKLAGPGWGFIGITDNHTVPAVHSLELNTYPPIVNGTRYVGRTWKPVKSVFEVQSVLEHSLLAYRAERTGAKDCLSPGPDRLSPLLGYRVGSRAPDSAFETRYFPSFATPVRLHSHAAGAPYIDPGTRRALTIDVWQDPAGLCPVEGITVSLDWMALPGLMYLRYRTTLAVWTFGIGSIIFSRQLRHFRLNGEWHSTGAALDLLCRRHTIKMCAAILVGQIAQALLVAEGGIYGMRLHAGISKIALSWVPFPLLVVGISFVLVSQGFLSATIAALNACIHRTTQAPRSPDNRILYGRPTLLVAGVSLCVCGAVIGPLPVQAAFVIIFVVHIVVSAWSCVPGSVIMSLHQGVLSLLFWQMPLQCVVVLVWIRHLMESPAGPFDGDHNALALLPVILLLGVVTTQQQLPTRNPIRMRVAEWCMLCLGLFALGVGVSGVHRICNLTSVALLAITCTLVGPLK